MQFWAKITGRAYVVDPGIEHEPRRFFDAFCWEIKPAKFQDLWFCAFWDELFFANFLWFFCFLSLLLARSRRAVANLDERVKKFIHTAFVWPVEVGEILMRLLILKVNKLVWIITQRNWLVSKIALGDHLVGFFCVTGPIFSLVGGALGYHSSFFILHSFLFQGVRVRGKG